MSSRLKVRLPKAVIPGKAGYRFGVKQTVEGFVSIAVPEWWHSGVAYEGGRNTYRGWPDQKGLRGCTLEITEANANRIWVRYAVNNGRGQSKPLDQEIRMDSTPCYLGGVRWWFRCPQNTCGRRVSRLYRESRFFLSAVPWSQLPIAA